MKSQLSYDVSFTCLESTESKMLPPEAQKKIQCWIRSRHLICSGNFFIFETVDYSAIDRFSAWTIAPSIGFLRAFLRWAERSFQ